jgi:predicted transcriptional regulator
MDMNKFESEIVDNEKIRKKKFKENAELRRDWVQTLLIRGNTQWEIAESLEISQSTISRDIQWIRSVAKKELTDTLEKKLPEEYHKYLVGINEVLRQAWDIALSGNAVEKTRLEALQFVIECSKHKMNVILNPPLQSNNNIKPFKRNSHVDSSENNNYNSFHKNQKEIEKNQF